LPCVLVLLAVCVGVVLSAPIDTTQAPSAIDQFESTPTIVVPSDIGNVTKYVKAAHRASLNFACNIDRITVTLSQAATTGFPDPITQVELEDHLGEPTNIEWAHVMQQFFESTDPRGQERQLGTLGGDLGEFLIVLQAIETQLGKEFSPEDVLLKFRSYLTVMSRDKFYYDIDTAAVDTLKSFCGCPNLNIADPPDSKKSLLRNTTHLPQANGNEFFKKVLADPTTYEIRSELVNSVLDAFYTVMWKKSDPLHRRIKFVLLKGIVEPKGFIMVTVPGYCNAQLLAPMISPELCAKQMGIYHGDAAVLLRTEIAGVLLYTTPEQKNAVVRLANTIATNAIKNVLVGHLEPIYTVAFEGF